MRWNKTQTGDKRIVKRFAFLPIMANNEVRWLELCTIEQRAYDVNYYVFPWFNVRFVDEKEEVNV